MKNIISRLTKKMFTVMILIMMICGISYAAPKPVKINKKQLLDTWFWNFGYNQEKFSRDEITFNKDQTFEIFSIHQNYTEYDKGKYSIIQDEKYGTTLVLNITNYKEKKDAAWEKLDLKIFFAINSLDNEKFTFSRYRRDFSAMGNGVYDYDPPMFNEFTKIKAGTKENLIASWRISKIGTPDCTWDEKWTFNNNGSMECFWEENEAQSYYKGSYEVKKSKNGSVLHQILKQESSDGISFNEINPPMEFWYDFKIDNESNIDYILLKLGTIRLNLFSQYISTCLNVLSDYKTILNQPIIKSIQKFENGIMIEKQLFNMKKYMLNFIKKLPDKKTNDPHIKEYIKFLEKEIEIGKKLGIDSDCYEINYLFNFFPKGIEIMCDYNTLECVYYNSKKNNKISGKALLPSPEFCFKLDPDKFGIKFFDFEFEIEDLDDIKNIMTQIWKIIQDKIQVAKLFIEPCLVQARMDLENKQKDNNKDKEIKRPISNKNIIDIDNKFTSIDNIKNKNIINSINDKTNTTEMTLSNNINDTNTINRANITVSKKNLTYT